MKAYLIAATALSAIMTVSPALAARICNNIPIVSPTPGAELPAGVAPTFRWQAEPDGTATRGIVISGDKGLALAADHRFRLHAGMQLPLGSYTWSLTFTGKDGKVICTTPPVHFAVTKPKPGKVADDFEAAAHNGFVVQTSAGPAQIFIRNGRYVIVLQNSLYTGPRTQDVNSDDFDGSTFALGAGVTGLEIYGNDNPNTVTGTTGSDIIFVYGGNDDVNPGSGPDEVHFGTGTDTSYTVDGQPDKIYFQQSVGGSKDGVDSVVVGP